MIPSPFRSPPRRVGDPIPRPLRALRLACRRLDIRPTPFLLLVSIPHQLLVIWQQRPNPPLGPHPWSHRPVARCLISTSRFGIGNRQHSNRTPLGLHRLATPIGAGWPVGAVWKHRRFRGWTWQGQPDAPIAHRILRLQGLDPTLNHGPGIDSFDRCIYIHGVGDETSLGRPASRGCIHLATNDLIAWFDRLPLDSLVWITASPPHLAEAGSPLPSGETPRPYGLGLL